MGAFSHGVLISIGVLINTWKVQLPANCCLMRVEPKIQSALDHICQIISPSSPCQCCFSIRIVFFIVSFLDLEI